MSEFTELLARRLSKNRFTRSAFIAAAGLALTFPLEAQPVQAQEPSTERCYGGNIHTSIFEINRIFAGVPVQEIELIPQSMPFQKWQDNTARIGITRITRTGNIDREGFLLLFIGEESQNDGFRVEGFLTSTAGTPLPMNYINNSKASELLGVDVSDQYLNRRTIFSNFRVRNPIFERVSSLTARGVQLFMRAVSPSDCSEIPGSKRVYNIH